MKSRVTGMNQSGLSEASKEASRTVRLHVNHVSRTMLLETRIGDLPSFQKCSGTLRRSSGPIPPAAQILG
jgi:hypothetical protein